MELIWDGKYKDGKRVAPVKIALPFQTIETVNESVQERQRALDFFSHGRDTEWRNRLIWGDKKYVLPSLLDEFAGKVNLIYIDPPFATGADFSFTATVPDDPDMPGDQGATFVKQPSILEQKAYRDTWGRGLDGYLQWMYETLVSLSELLAENGTLYLHCNQDMSPHLKTILDEIFGANNHLNDVIWYFENKPKFSFSKVFPRDWEIILVYAKSNGKHTFQHAFVPVKEVQQQAVVAWDPVAKKRVAKRDEEGKIIYETRTEKLMGAVWTIPIIHPIAHERLNYPTQKPVPLLERIIKASSNEGDLVLDCFCGSGTTAAVAEKLGRRWITCDLGRFAIHTARKRLLSIGSVQPFVVQNLGKYERQAWQRVEFASPEDAQLREARYRHFILDLYGADAIGSGAWLHGIKLGRMVHVGAVDAPVTLSDVKAIATETWHRVGSGDEAPEEAGVDILGWDFAFELNELGKQVAKDAGIDVRFRKIPREVLEKKAVDQGDIRFFELAALSVDAEPKPRRTVELTLKDFIIAPDDVPQEVMSAITHWSQLIDYWAVDWDFKGDTFHNQWQAYRTKKNVKLERKASHSYDTPGRYTVLVKVIDLLGNDTTKALEVEVKG